MMICENGNYREMTQQEVENIQNTPPIIEPTKEELLAKALEYFEQYNSME